MSILRTRKEEKKKKWIENEKKEIEKNGNE